MTCTKGRLGKLTKHSFKAGTSACYTFDTDELTDTEVVVDVDSDEYDQVTAVVQIGDGEERRHFQGSIEIIEESILRASC